MLIPMAAVSKMRRSLSSLPRSFTSLKSLSRQGLIALANRPLAEQLFDGGGELGAELHLVVVLRRDVDHAVGELDLEGDRHLARMLDQQIAQPQHAVGRD